MSWIALEAQVLNHLIKIKVMTTTLMIRRRKTRRLIILVLIGRE